MRMMKTNQEIDKLIEEHGIDDIKNIWEDCKKYADDEKQCQLMFVDALDDIMQASLVIIGTINGDI